MISKTKIDRKLKRKTDKRLAGTIIKAKKLKNWFEIANLISSSRRKQAGINLEEIEKNTKEGDTVLIPGKVLGVGNITKKIRVAALYFSESAREKLKEKKCEIVSVEEEIKANPNARGIKVLR